MKCTPTRRVRDLFVTAVLFMHDENNNVNDGRIIERFIGTIDGSWLKRYTCRDSGKIAIIKRLNMHPPTAAEISVLNM